MYKTAAAPGQANAMNDHTFTVPDSARPVRLDKFLSDCLRSAGISREKIKQAVAQGLATRNGAVCSSSKTTLVPGDVVSIRASAPAEALTPEQGDLTVLYQDQDLAVLNKPPGLTVHPAPSCPEGTLAHRLIRYFPQLALQGGLRPGIVHRLDKDTSGLLLAALTEKARLALARAFAAREVRKEYLALVHGVPAKAKADINAPLGRHPSFKTKMAVLAADQGGREAASSYRVLHADPAGRFSLLAVAIHTGRTHQIRVHCAHIGHPLVGDTVYGPSGGRALDAPRQMLHAWKLRFTHPESGADMAFVCPPPADFAATARMLAVPPQHIVVTGSAGCGKSTLMAALREAGLPVWSADQCVRNLYEAGADGAYLLRKRYGSRFVPEENGPVDKNALFAAMRESEALRREVEGLVHPLVRHSLDAFRTTAPVTVAEIPLYFESGWQTPGNELLIGVYCPFALRRTRMMHSRGWDEATVAAMESWQWPEAKKIRSVDLVLDNSGKLEDLRRRSAALVRVLARLRERAAVRVEQSLRRLWEEPNV